MPRPGPRPYECVRRAWHSDRHQPMRGSLIQEIFRIVNEIHSSATKKNKEWQEKLPIVVLKAEEIMYSKANSEAEYLDLKTLWDRANNAINTIIRLDETTETGVFLQPCIEAALSLGCTPRRASRSQRNNNPSYYLSARSSEPVLVPAPSSNLKDTSQGNCTNNALFISHHSDFTRSASTSFTRFGMVSHGPVVQNNNCSIKNSSFLPENFPAGDKNQCPSIKNCHSNSWSAYSLYYGDHSLSKEPVYGFNTLSKLKSLSKELVDIGIDHTPSHKENSSNKITQANIRSAAENSSESGFDLSLRLGRPLFPHASIENSCTIEIEEVGSRTYLEENKPSKSSSQNSKGFSFFHKSTADMPLDLCSCKRGAETESSNVEITVKKQKAVLHHLPDEKQFCWQPKLPI